MDRHDRHGDRSLDSGAADSLNHAHLPRMDWFLAGQRLRSRRYSVIQKIKLVMNVFGTPVLTALANLRVQNNLLYWLINHSWRNSASLLPIIFSLQLIAIQLNAHSERLLRDFFQNNSRIYSRISLLEFPSLSLIFSFLTIQLLLLIFKSNMG